MDTSYRDFNKEVDDYLNEQYAAQHAHLLLAAINRLDEAEPIQAHPNGKNPSYRPFRPHSGGSRTSYKYSSRTTPSLSTKADEPSVSTSMTAQCSTEASSHGIIQPSPPPEAHHVTSPDNSGETIHHDEKIGERIEGEGTCPPNSNMYASSPVVITLGTDNYLNWKIFIMRKIEQKGWLDLVDEKRRIPAQNLDSGGIDTPSSSSQPKTSAFAKRQMKCSNLILQHVQEKYWHMINPKERDPFIMLREIHDVWGAFMRAAGKGWFYLAMKELEVGKGSVFDFVAQFKWLYESFKKEGGSLPKERLSEKLSKGLESRGLRPEGWDLSGVEDEHPDRFNDEYLEIRDYLQRYLDAEYPLAAERKELVTRLEDAKAASVNGESVGSSTPVEEHDGNGNGLGEEWVMV
ncbi:hypothetical protein TWF506_002369 [Arthrobotrys conoides]|uniref:Uncharacterized protein n=1 Tax=Arthrobotrys conoides TaxID=74498 RepID=A0AAN8RJQ9_9PEZI